MLGERELVVKATVLVLRQHMRLRPGVGGAAVTIAIDDLATIVAARTGLAVGREPIRNLVDALVATGLLRKYPGRRYMATSYALAAVGASLDARIEQFLAEYAPRWEPFSRQLSPIVVLVARYELLFRSRMGGLPRSPALPEVAQTARLNGVRWLERKCRQLELRPEPRTARSD